MNTEQQGAMARELRAKGQTWDKIAAAIGVNSRQRAHQLATGYRPPSSPIPAVPYGSRLSPNSREAAKRRRAELAREYELFVEMLHLKEGVKQRRRGYQKSTSKPLQTS